jgi:hypothetical protein
MLKIETAVIALTLGTAPAVADVGRELARCQLVAEQTYPKPDDERSYTEPNIKKRAAMVDYHFSEHCNEVNRRIFTDCINNPQHDPQYYSHSYGSGQIQDRLLARPSCYQSDSWWRRWLGW